MKKILGILLSLLLLSSAIQAQVTAEIIAPYQQTGAHNYYGVKVTLSQTYDHDVTVTGYICDDGGGFNANHPFTLTVLTGYLTAETDIRFYETDPTASAAIFNLGIVYNYAGVSITYEFNENILKFNSAADVNTVVDQLDADYESYNDSYESQYSNLTADQLDDMDDQNNFDEFTSLKNFETLFSGFSSKRLQIETTENTWLSNDLSGTDPDDIDFTFDDAENTVFNNSYQLKIGNDIYEMRSTGLYNLTSGNMTMISEYSNFVFAFPYISKYENEKKLSGPSYSNLPNYETILNAENSKVYFACLTNIRKSKRYSFGSNREFKLKVAVNSSLFRSSGKGKVVSLKKKGGHWKRYRTEMAVGCAGNLYDADTPACPLSKIVDRRNPTTGYKNKKSFKTIQRHAIPVKYSTNSNEFYSFYQLPNNTYNSLMVF
jgi:hypothetical protein